VHVLITTGQIWDVLCVESIIEVLSILAVHTRNGVTIDFPAESKKKLLPGEGSICNPIALQMFRLGAKTVSISMPVGGTDRCSPPYKHCYIHDIANKIGLSAYSLLVRRVHTCRFTIERTCRLTIARWLGNR